MGFYSSSLDHFDPMKDEVSWAPFPQARQIAWRARYLLRDRSAKQVRGLASEISSWIDAYFESEKDQAIAMIKSEGRHDLLETDEDGNFRDFLSEAYDHFDIRTAENTEPIDAAKEVFENMDILHDPDIPDAKEYEYFAAMALAMVGGYVQSLESTFDFRLMKRVPRATKEYEAHEISVFGKSLIEAMEVVTYAESRKKMAELNRLTEIAIERAENLAKEGVEKGLQEIRIAETEKKKAWGKIGKEKSLQGRNISREAVLVQHDSSPTYRTKSIAAAAAELWQWLSQEARRKDIEVFSVKTIEGWISAHRKGKATG